ncbi:hypothetical protein AMECASPLE_029969 [Ameca splendens]|uniref:Uncharacterized protein n=1 Tax=Ameca splendens TaxID=208324 RepID=A0ABV0YI46_9TELE
MDSLQSFISSFTQLLREFASNSATSAFRPLRQHSTRSLAPPTDIHHGNARPGSSLKNWDGLITSSYS